MLHLINKVINYLLVLLIHCYLNVYMQVVSVPPAVGWQYPSLSTETSYIFGNNKLNSCITKSCGCFFLIKFCRSHPFVVNRRWPPHTIRLVWKKKKELNTQKQSTGRFSPIQSTKQIFLYAGNGKRFPINTIFIHQSTVP